MKDFGANAVAIDVSLGLELGIDQGDVFAAIQRVCIDQHFACEGEGNDAKCFSGNSNGFVMRLE